MKTNSDLLEYSQINTETTSQVNLSFNAITTQYTVKKVKTFAKKAYKLQTK